MKFMIYYHRDTKQMLYAGTPNADDDVPEDLRGKVFVLHPSAFDGSIPYFLKFSVKAEMPSYEFRTLFADRAIDIKKGQA